MLPLPQISVVAWPVSYVKGSNLLPACPPARPSKPNSLTLPVPRAPPTPRKEDRLSPTSRTAAYCSVLGPVCLHHTYEPLGLDFWEPSFGILNRPSLADDIHTTWEAPRYAAKMAARTVIPIDSNWQFKQADKDGDEFRAVAQFPTNVHLDLMHHRLIPDPFIGKNENDVQWVGEAKWTYKTTFATPAASKSAKAVLSFEGLDTFATVTLNGEVILETDNMFIPERVDVTKHLSQTADNELVIDFDSAYLRGWKRVEKYPNHVWSCWNGDNSRLAVRKAQYHWVSCVIRPHLQRFTNPD